MMDEAELYKRFVGGPDQYNMPEPDRYTYLATLPCAFRPSPGSSAASSEGMTRSEVPLLDGLISFNFDVERAHEVDLSNFDRVKIVKLHGERLDKPLLFDLAGPARRDNLANIFPLKRVTEREAEDG
jgi:hypothetical protein